MLPFIETTKWRKSTSLAQGQNLPISKYQLNLPILTFGLPFKITEMFRRALICFLTSVQQIFLVIRLTINTACRTASAVRLCVVCARVYVRCESQESLPKTAAAKGLWTLLPRQLTRPPWTVSNWSNAEISLVWKKMMMERQVLRSGWKGKNRCRLA